MRDARTPDPVRAALRARWAALSACVGAATLALLADLPLALLVGRVIDGVAPAGGAAAAPGPWHVGRWEVWALVALIGLRWWMRWAQLALGEAVAQGVLAEARLRMFTHLHRVRLSRLAKRDPGRTVVRFAGDAASLRAWIVRSLIETPADLLLVGAVLIVLLVLHPVLGVAGAAPLAVCVPVLLWVYPRVQNRTREARSAQAALSGVVVSSLSRAAALRRTGMERRARRQAGGELRRMRSVLTRRGRLEAVLRASVMTGASGALVAVAGAGAWLLGRGELSAGTVVSATWIAALLGGPLNRLVMAALIHGRAQVARRRMTALLELPRERRGRGGRAVAPVASAVRLRLNQVVLARGGGHRTGVIDAVARSPGAAHVLGSRDACDALVAALLREARPVEGRIGLNRRALRRYPRAALRTIIWHADAEGAAARAFDPAHRAAWEAAPAIGTGQMADARGGPVASRLRGGIAAGTARGCSVLLIDTPHDLDDATAGAIHAWAARDAGDMLVLVLGGAARGELPVLDLRAEAERAAAEPPATRAEPAGAPEAAR